MPIPMFNYPDFRPYSNVQPFTVRDGATHLMTLEALREWIRDDLVPHLDKEITELVENWESNVTDIGTQFQEISAALILTAEGLAGDSAASAAAAEAAKLAAEAARDLAQQYANDAVEAQDGAIADLLDEEGSETRTKLNTLYVAVATYNALADVINSGRLSVEIMDTRFGEKVDNTYLTEALQARDLIIDAVNDDIDDLELLTQAGRLSQSAMDQRYKQVDPIPHAVFIGSSNSVAGTTWVEDFVTQMGYIGHNYSVGGGSFTGVGVGTFTNQVAAAIADTSYNKSLVKYFFLCDVGNDMRAVANVQSQAESVFASISNAYPNARIIVLPAVWGNAPGNNNGNVLNSISMRYQELVNASLNFPRVELIDKSWTWLADGGNWMRAGEVHPNVAGYARIADFMVKYMKGASVVYNQGIKAPTPKPAINAGASYWTCGRDGNIATLTEGFRINPVAADTELGQLDYGLWPIQTVIVPVVGDVSRTVTGAIVIFTNGLIRSYGGLATGAHAVQTSWRVF